MLTVGDQLPAFALADQTGQQVGEGDFVGHRTLIYFYPKANTPGCTQQACLLRDFAVRRGDAVRIVGVSPDSQAALQRFDERHQLGFTLLSDPDHRLAETFGVWQEKKNYGKVYMGIVRSAFLFDEDGRLTHAWPTISPKDTPLRLVEALGAP